MNFYVISFLWHPARTFRILMKAIFTGAEEARYAKRFIDRISTCRQWRKVARGAAAALDLAELSCALGMYVGIAHGARLCEVDGVGLDQIHQ